MILGILLFFSCVILVSTNTGFPVIPAQTHPIYQQNGYANPSANRIKDILPYLQGMLVQNQSPTQNLSPYDIKQLLLNKILSNPSVQPISDSLSTNFRGYGSNLVEIANNPIAKNPVNNYFVAPTAFEYQTNGIKKESKEEEKPKKSKRQRSSKSKRKHNDVDKSQKDKSENNSQRHDRKPQNLDITREINKKSRKRSRKQNAETSSPNEKKITNESEFNKNSRNKKRKSKEHGEIKTNPIEENRDENLKARRRHKKKHKLEGENIEKAILESQPLPDKVPNQIKDGLDVNHLSEGIIEENRIARNSKHEETDLMKTLPIMPQNVANDFMKGLPQFDKNPLMNNFFANYENIYQSMLTNKMFTNHKIHRKPNKPKRTRKHHRRRNGQNNGNSTEVAPVVANAKIVEVTPKIDIVSTERTIYIHEKKSITQDEGLKSLDIPSEMREKDNEEFGDENKKEDLEPNKNGQYVYDGYIDDYYPLFTDNAVFNADNKEIIIKKLGDTKYYYVTDKDDTEFINQLKFEEPNFPDRVIKEYELNKQYGDIEEQSLRNAIKNEDIVKKEEIQFRSPPLLESPDFQTRKVEKGEINSEPSYNFDENPRFGGDKSSIYSEAKTSYYESKQNGIKSTKDKDVETVYARSKVVKYSPVYGSDEDSSFAGSSNHATIDETYLKDGGTTYVLAKSMDYPTSFW